MVDLFSTTVLPEEITSLLLFDNVPLGVVFQFDILWAHKGIFYFIYGAAHTCCYILQEVFDFISKCSEPQFRFILLNTQLDRAFPPAVDDPLSSSFFAKLACTKNS